MENKSEHLQEKKILNERWEQSGKSIIQFCRDENLSYHTFHYWRKKLASKNTVTTKKTGSKFIKLKSVSKEISGAGYCELILSNGHRLLFHQQPEVDFVKQLMK